MSRTFANTRFFEGRLWLDLANRVGCDVHGATAAIANHDILTRLRRGQYFLQTQERQWINVLMAC